MSDGTSQAPAAPQLTPHDQAMVAKVDAAHSAAAVAAGTQAPAPAAPADPASKPARPDNVPEKFWDAEKGTVNTEALLKSYTELEKGKGAPAAETPPVAPADPSQVAAQEAAAKAGLQETDLVTAFESGGDFTPEQYAALEKAGYSKQLVGQYIAGVKAQAQLLNQEAWTAAGGEQQYTAMTQWAAANLPQADIAAYDQAVTGSPEQRKLAIQGLKARFEAAQGTEPTLLGNESGASATAESFASRAEMTTAMRDPRYRKDPAYRASVERKVGNSAF